jgi:hypothetical protein
MKNIRIIPLTIVIAFLMALLSACAPKEIILTGADQEAVLAYSEAKTDNLLAAINAGDYTAFSKDFDSDMLNAMPESQFMTLKQDRDAKIGKYISRQVASVSQSGDFIIVSYTAKFEKETEVTVRVVFRAAEPNNISGLWFNK